MKRLSELDPEKYDIMKKARMEIAEAATLAKLSQTDLYNNELNDYQEKN